MRHPHWLDHEEYPFESRFWDADGGRMHYVDVGEGRPVVLVHGVPTWSFCWRKAIARLAPHARCVAMDHVGFGLSDKPETWEYTPERLAANVESLIEGLGLGRVTLVVHDWGGPIGLRYALRRPENVERIVLMNTWMWSSKGEMRQELAARGLASPVYRMLEDRFNFTSRVFIPQVMGDRTKLSHLAHQHYVEPLRERRDRRGCWALIRAILHSGDWLEGLWAERGKLAKIPTLIQWGLADRAFTRRDLERWRGVFEEKEVHAYTRVGHFPQEEMDEEGWRTFERFATGRRRTMLRAVGS